MIIPRTSHLWSLAFTFMIISCNQSINESQNIELREILNLNSGDNSWNFELNDTSGPMWEISICDRGESVSRNFPQNDGSKNVKIIISSIEPYGLIIVPLEGGRVEIKPGQSIEIYSGNIISLNYSNSTIRVFPDYYLDGSRGSFSFEYKIVTTDDLSLIKPLHVRAYRMDSL